MISFETFLLTFLSKLKGNFKHLDQIRIRISKADPDIAMNTDSCGSGSATLVTVLTQNTDPR